MYSRHLVSTMTTNCRDVNETRNKIFATSQTEIFLLLITIPKYLHEAFRQNLFISPVRHHKLTQ